MANRLEHASSRYLRQHAHQLVDWWSYSAEPFAEARRRDRPVMLSIGYAACHWCHVMSRESFDDPQVAAYLNEHFVSIKVDREQHPLVDDTYMLATQALTGAGGWPMTVFTLPDGRTFHAGTYFPPRQRGRVPSFMQVLTAVTETYTQRREEVEQQAAALAEHLVELSRGQHQMMKFSADPATVQDGNQAEGQALEVAVHQWIKTTRSEGGFTPAPKFPPTQSLVVLWQQVLTHPEPGPLFDAAATTTEAIVLGGLQDHVGGGFARYCVDEHWAVPHFEKMLYDNAQLLRLLGLCQLACTQLAATGTDPARTQRATALAEACTRAAAGTATWLRDSMLTGQSGDRHRALAASRDADSLRDGQHVEGGAYTLTREEFDQAAAGLDSPLPEDLIRLAEVAEDPGHYCLSLLRMPRGTERETWQRLLQAVRELVAERPAPARDSKVVAGWNGLAIEALCQAAIVFENPGHRQLAEQVAHTVWEIHVAAATGTLARVSFENQAEQGNEGTLEDYAGMALGFAALALAEPSGPWALRRDRLLEQALGFIDEQGLARDTRELDPALAAQRGQQSAATALDDAVPAASSLLARALLLRAQHTMAVPDQDGAGPDNEERVDRDMQAAQALVGHSPVVAARFPSAVAGALEVQGLLQSPIQYLRISGGEPRQLGALRRLATVLGLPVGAGDEQQPAGPGNALRIYPCRHTTCQAPVADAAALLQTLRRG